MPRRKNTLGVPTDYPNVYKQPDGRFLVRARTKGQDGKLQQVRRVLECHTAREASRELSQLIQDARKESAEAPLFANYAPDLIRRKVATGEIQSTATVRRRNEALDMHLIPTFGQLRMDQITRREILAWRDDLARKAVAGAISPQTGNTRLKILFLTVRAWVDQSEQPSDPTRRVKLLSSSLRRTYTREHPNALRPEQ